MAWAVVAHPVAAQIEAEAPVEEAAWVAPVVEAHPAALREVRPVGEVPLVDQAAGAAQIEAAPVAVVHPVAGLVARLVEEAALPAADRAVVEAPVEEVPQAADPVAALQEAAVRPAAPVEEARPVAVQAGEVPPVVEAHRAIPAVAAALVEAGAAENSYLQIPRRSTKDDGTICVLSRHIDRQYCPALIFFELPVQAFNGRTKGKHVNASLFGASCGSFSTLPTFSPS